MGRTTYPAPACWQLPGGWKKYCLLQCWACLAGCYPGNCPLMASAPFWGASSFSVEIGAEHACPERAPPPSSLAGPALEGPYRHEERRGGFAVDVTLLRAVGLLAAVCKGPEEGASGLETPEPALGPVPDQGLRGANPPFLRFFSCGVGAFFSSSSSLSSSGAFSSSLSSLLSLCSSTPLGPSSCWVALGLPSSSSWELL